MGGMYPPLNAGNIGGNIGGRPAPGNAPRSRSRTPPTRMIDAQTQWIRQIRGIFLEVYPYTYAVSTILILRNQEQS